MAGTAEVYLLPPRARAHDWPLAGASAGLVLALAEQLVAVAGGVRLPPGLALLLAAGNVLLVATPCALIGLGLRRARLSHSSLVLGVVGPMLYAAVAVPLVVRGGARALATAALLAAGVGTLTLVGARLADRAERAGIAASGPFVWGATALLLVGSAQLASGATPPPGAVWSLLFAAALVVAGTVLAHEVIKRRGGSGRLRFGPLLALLATATVLSATLPLWLPWLLVDDDPRDLGRSPANLLIVALPAAESQPTLDMVALQGTERSGIALDALLTRRDGGWIAASLARAGYATAAIVRDPRLARARGAVDLDARPGGLALLEGPASWAVAAPLLLGPAAPALWLAGQDTHLRGPETIGAEARRWLLDWRARRAAAPFFLFVDLHGKPVGDVDAALATILDRLDMLGAAQTTLVAVAATGTGGRLVVRAPEMELPEVLAGTSLDVAPPPADEGASDPPDPSADS